MTEDDIKALEIIKWHIRYFKKPWDGEPRFSLYFTENTMNKDDFEFISKWLKKVEKERGWKL